MKNIKLLEEINVRKEDEMDSQRVLGTEIKSRRISLSRTQSSLSSELCSISYYSKIENNKIKAKEHYLKEIFRRLELQDEKIDLLLNLDISLKKVIKAFHLGAFGEIEQIKREGEGLINYRYRIIEFIYTICIRDMVSANMIASNLMKIIGTMSNNDLLIYSLFYGILLFYNQEFDMALRTLTALNDYNMNIKEILYIQQKYILYLDLVLNKITLFTDHQKAFQYYIEHAFYEEVDELHYIKALYFFQNKCYKEFSNVYKIIKSDVYKKSLSVLCKLKFGKRLKWKKQWLMGTRPFYYYLGLLKMNRRKAIEEISKLNDASFDYDFNLLYLEYLILPNQDEQYRYILNSVIPTLLRTKLPIVRNFFYNKMADLVRVNGKYKSFTDMYKELREME